MSGQRFAIFATAEWDRPVAAATTLSDAPPATAARMRSFRRSVHSRTFCAADSAAERSGIVVGALAGGELGVDVDEAPEALLGHPELDLSVAVLAGALVHVPTVHKVSARVNKVDTR